MEIRSFSDSIKKAFAATLIAGTALSFSSCDRIHEDLQPCPQGLSLRFIYEYNMEDANAFKHVDCLTVLFYDSDGNYVTTKTNTNTEDLKDENWRMTVDLAPGNYTVIAYGGLECPESSFSFTAQPSTVKMQQLEVELDPDCLTDPERRHLHDLYYGRLLNVSVEQSDTEYREYTVEMMKDTNNLRVMMQQADGTPITESDFDFKVVDDNTLMGWDNEVIPTRSVDYFAWSRGDINPGELQNGSPASVAYAELSFPRLVTDNSPKLVITRKSDGHNVVNIPLIKYLLMLKSDANPMGPQEFLDRESRWSLFFFLQGGTWLYIEIVVDDWTVRINNTEFGL